ncbi:hypothetical protein [Pseudorhodoferax sp. Leaf267]|uniref:hypothetical protein n=1 Tax=Pseudorhodoferax sp. Leaf267 TaxID=1736316 RepID=UPI0006F8B829|nr:hypothetical protein [Pseudorhodoferax sp. Leaf267]KQP22963.1 hypothetical protein ASF43_03475 [Pseudorhodoferax sp. Leaf267]
MDTTTETTYTVALCDYPELPDRERIAAEVRYGRALERRLGSAEGVAQTLRAVVALAEEGHDEDPSAQTLALRWRLANTAARQLGLQGLGDLPSAYFHVALR